MHPLEVLLIPEMPIAVKVVLLAVCVVALVFVALKLVLPLILLYVGGVGILSPLPRRLTSAYPKLAIYLFVFGGPLLFVCLVATFIWLLRLRTSP